VVFGVKFYGSPWQPELNNWSFNLPRGEALRKKWDLIPLDTQVLITHGPPHGILDYVDSDKEHVGCEDLLDVITKKLKFLKYHIFGHIHGGTGVKPYKGVNYCNVSVLDEDYNCNKPVTIFDYK
jgi:hypothetical protein